MSIEKKRVGNFLRWALLLCRIPGEHFASLTVPVSVLIKSKIHRFLLIYLCSFSAWLPGFGQHSDSARTKYPNIIKYGISSYALYPNSFHLGYERVLTRNKSFYIFGGTNQFPARLNLNLANTNFSGSRNKSGYSIGAEFRFY